MRSGLDDGLLKTGPINVHEQRLAHDTGSISIMGVRRK